MTSSLTYSASQTFTIVHARHMGAKVAADLKRIQRLYGAPSDAEIMQYEQEIIELLRHDYLASVIYGYKRNGLWIPPTVSYGASELASGSGDDDPGRIKAGANISNARFGSYLSYSAAWGRLTTAEQKRFESTLLIQRTTASAPGIENGYFENDKTYSAGGRSLSRASVRSY